MSTGAATAGQTGQNATMTVAAAVRRAGVLLCMTLSALCCEAQDVAPLRVVRLITGERFHGELLRADQTAVEFRWRGHTRLRVPTATVASIENPPGMVDVLDRRPTASSPLMFPVVGAGLVHVAAITSEIFRCEFGDEALILTRTADDSLDVTLPDGWTIGFRQPVSKQAAHSLMLRWTASTWDLRCGSALWMRGTKPASSLTSITGTADRVVVRRVPTDAPSLTKPFSPGPLDAIVRADGDVWFGEFLRTTGDGLELRGQDDAVALVPWTEFAALHLRQRALDPTLLPPVTGQVCEFVGPSAWDPYRLDRERWIAAAAVVPFPAKAVDHPLLGRIPLMNHDDVQRRIPLGRRSWRWLHPSPIHLGNNIVDEYQSPLPQGTSIGGIIELTAPPSGPVILSLDAVGLEPRGDGTLSTQPFLAQLQAGRLRTELVLNGELIGDLNARLAHRPPPGQAVRLTMSISADRWRTGRNEWLIRQQPAGDDPAEFDDCELSRIALEE